MHRAFFYHDDKTFKTSLNIPDICAISRYRTKEHKVKFQELAIMSVIPRENGKLKQKPGAIEPIADKGVKLFNSDLI